MILFAKEEIIGIIFPNLIAFGLFLRVIEYFAVTGKWLRCSAGRQEIKLLLTSKEPRDPAEITVSFALEKLGWGTCL